MEHAIQKNKATKKPLPMFYIELKLAITKKYTA